MRFKNLDLNLLVALDLLMAERNVSRAARRMHITQSAMSNALARLREYFEDPLLVVIGRRMELTPKAESMRHSVRDIIVRVESTISTDVQFDPSGSTRSFRILLSDYTSTALMPRVLALAEKEGASVKFELLPQVERPAKAIERGDADIVIVPRPLTASDHPSELLFKDDFLCVAWKEGRYGKLPLTRAQYLEACHVLMVPIEAAAGFDAAFLEERGFVRRVDVTCYNFISLPYLVVGTNRLATCHGMTARHAATFLPIVCHELPLPTLPLEQCVQWHEYKSQDPGIRWLRTLIKRAAADLKPELQVAAE